MDSRDVTKVIRAVARPRLQGRGFTSVLGRSAYRHHDRGIDIVNFGSMNSYVASGVGCTTFSFAVTVGFFPSGFPRQGPDRVTKDGLPAPSISACEIRYSLEKSLFQPLFRPYASVGNTKIIDRTHVWYVLSDGSNVEACVADAADRLDQDGIPWLDRWHDRRATLDWAVEQAKWVFSQMHEPRPEYVKPVWPKRDGVELIGQAGPFIFVNAFAFGAWAARAAGDEVIAREMVRLGAENELTRKTLAELGFDLDP